MWQISAVGEFVGDDGTQEAALVTQLQTLFASLPDSSVRSFSLVLTADVPMVPGSGISSAPAVLTIKQAEKRALDDAVAAVINAKGADAQVLP